MLILQSSPQRKRPKATSQVIVGKLCWINYLLVCVAISLFIICLVSPVVKNYRLGGIALSVFLIAFEVYARPFSYYGANEEGLTEYRHGRKRRQIPWSKVKQVGVQLDHLTIGSIRGVIVTIEGAPKYAKDSKKTTFRYFLTYRPYVLYIYDYEKSLPQIEKYYGIVDYTKFGDLPEHSCDQGL